MNRKKLYGTILACFLILTIPTIPSLEYKAEYNSENMTYFNNGKNLNYAGEPIWIYDSDLYVKHVETADLNYDGINDVIAGEYSSDYYDDPSKVYGIDGTNGNTIWTYDELRDGVRSMTIGDLNDDGVMDVIAGASKGSSTPDGKVHAIDGTDGSLLWTFIPGGTGDSIGDIAIGDFDGNMLPDVAIACWDDYVYAINGTTGNEMWNTYIGSIFVDGVDTGDVNNDGIDDVSFANSYLAGWDNLQGVLDGTDGSTIWNQTVPYKVEETLLSDIDNDGELEAIFGVHKSNSNAEVHVRNASNGNLEWNYTLGPDIGLSPDVFLLSDDIDEDGDLDLVVGNEYVNNYIILFDGDSNTPTWISEELDGYPRDLSSGDVIGDGDKNIIAATYDRVQVLNGNDGTKEWYYPVGGTILGVGCSDFDDDGVLDVLCSGGAEYTGHDPAKSVWALKSTEESPILWEFDAEEYGSAVAIDDLNGDIYMDVIGVTSNDKAWAIDGENGEELWNWTSTDNVYSVTTGDFNNDGQIDVAVAGYDNKVTALYGNNGTVMWQIIFTDYIGRKCLQSADLNNDGNIDVIAGDKDGFITAIYGNNGSKLWSVSGLGSINEVELAQMDGYGPLDIITVDGIKAIVINGSNGNILWNYDQNTAYAKHVEVFDVNNDSILDIAIGVNKMGATPGRLIMVDGVTRTSLWTVYPFLPCSDYGLAHGDLNNDGIQDLVAAGNYDDRKIHAYNGTNGNELWFYPTGGDVNVVEASDVNNDGLTEVIAGSDDQYVYVLWGSNGSCLWNISTADDVIHLQIGDISGNGYPNIVVITFGFDGIVYAYRTLFNFQNPVASFTCEPTINPLTYETIYLNSTSYDPDGYIVNWTWVMDDGTTLYGENVTHQYSNDGIFNIILTVTDNDGVTSSNGLKINVINRPPTANFNYSPLNPTTLDVITFSDLSNDIDGTVVNWTWDFDDGNLSYIQNPNHQYNQTGEYNVSLIIKDDDGSSNSTYKLITVLEKGPTANFTWTPTNPTDLDVIQFTSLSTDKAIVNWTWDFDDGNHSYDENPTHQYDDDGSYNVTLTVKDDYGINDSITKQVNVSNVGPIADYTYTPSSPTTNTIISFTDLSYDLDGIIINWTWDFFDGNISYNQNPTHQYTKTGEYNVSLTIKDDDESTDIIYKIINVSKGVPIADFTYSPQSPTIQDIIQFTDSSTDTDGTIVNWTWNFGDGNISYNQNPTHQYHSNGTYQVNLKVTDNDDLSDNISKRILIGGIFIENISSEWNFVSIPFNQTIDKLDLLVKYNGAVFNWTQATTSDNPIILNIIYDYNRTNQNYEGSLTFKPGRGYWLYAYYECEIWILNMEIPTPDYYITTMETSWNAIGIPINISVNKTDLIFWYEGSEYNWTEATQGGDPIVLGFIYDYNRTTQSYIDISELKPGRSYWVYAYYNCSVYRPD